MKKVESPSTESPCRQIVFLRALRMRDSSTSINSTEPDMRNSINQRTYTIQALTSVACIGASAAKPIASASSYITSIEWLTGNALRCLHNRLHTLRTPHALRLQRCQRALNRHYGAIGAGQAHGNARLHDRIARGDALSRCIVVRAIFSIGHQIAAPCECTAETLRGMGAPTLGFAGALARRPRIRGDRHVHRGGYSDVPGA